MADLQPWAQQEGESNRWFHRFEMFKLMGTGRSQTAVFNQERVQKGLPESIQPTGAWRKRIKEFNWVDRADAWDKHESEVRAAEIEARWKAEIMGPNEVLGRLTRMGRFKAYQFYLWDEFGRITGFNMRMLKEHGDLVKKMGTKETTMGTEFMVELYDGQAAVVKMGQHYKMFTDQLALSNPDGSPLQGDDGIKFDRAVSSLAEALRDFLPGAGDQPQSPVEPAK